MGSDYHPIARALLGDAGDEPDHAITCCICGGPAMCSGFVWRAVKTWNRLEAKLADKSERRPDYISTGDMLITCGFECGATLYRQKHAEVQRENETTLAFLAMLYAGKYNAESLAWLRAHHHARRVEQVLARQGTQHAT